MPTRPKRQGVQLAYPAEEGRVNRLGETFFVQPKLNGERAKVIEFHGEPYIISSYGNEFQFLDHLKAKVKNLWKKVGMPLPLDGEIYVHGWTRERIDSALRRTVNRNPDVEGLELHVFDLPLKEVPQDVRLQIRDEWISRGKHIYSVPTFNADKHNWVQFTSAFLDLGYEGSILRRKSSMYSEKRTVDMLKYKPTAYDTYKILDVIEAISKEGEPKGMVGAFLVEGEEGGAFSVGAGKLKHDKRIAYWRARRTLPGMMLRVKHGVIKTTGGVPTAAVAVEVLDNELYVSTGL